MDDEEVGENGALTSCVEYCDNGHNPNDREARSYIHSWVPVASGAPVHGQRGSAAAQRSATACTSAAQR